MRGSIDPGEKNNIIVVYDDILFSAPPGPDGAARPLLLSVMMESGWRDAKRVYRPEDPEEDVSRKPCILWFPGGGWTHVERNFMNGEMAFLARAGYVVVSVSYRTSAQAHLPGQLEDAASALRFLGEHAGEYRIDRSRIGVMGRSAGAYFAVWLGLNEMLPGTGEMPGRDGLPAVRACCDLFGPVDLERLIDYELSPNAFPKSRVSRPKDSHAGKLLGLNGSEPPEEIRRMAREMSPLHHITDRMCPLLILHGDNDPVVPAEISGDRLYDAVRAAGLENRAEYLTVRHGGHGSREFFQEETRERILDFFGRTMGCEV